MATVQPFWMWKDKGDGHSQRGHLASTLHVILHLFKLSGVGSVSDATQRMNESWLASRHCHQGINSRPYYLPPIHMPSSEH